jgi:hypothetical protein
MTAAVTRAVQLRAGQLARICWLPSGGAGNGLDDDSWVPVLEVSERIVPQVLGVLREAGVPGYAAPAERAAGRLGNGSRRIASWRLWVGASGYGRAETALLAVMPSLARESAERADSAWR